MIQAIRIEFPNLSNAIRQKIRLDDKGVLDAKRMILEVKHLGNSRSLADHGEVEVGSSIANPIRNTCPISLHVLNLEAT